MKELRRLNPYFWKYRYRFFLGLIFVIASNLFSVFPAKAVQKAIDELTVVLGGVAGPDTRSVVGAVVLKCTLLIFLFALIRGVFMFFMRQGLIVMSRKIEYDMKNEVFDHYQQLDQAFYRRNNTGDLMARISEDVSRVRMYTGPALMYFTNLLATFVVVIPAMVQVSAELALYVLLPLPVLSFSIFYVHNIINRRSDAIQAQLSTITSFTQEAYNGIRVIKAFGVEKASAAALFREVLEFRKRSMALARVDATFFPLMIFLTGMSTVLTVYLGGRMTIQGEITLGNIAEYVVYINLLVWPVASLGFTTSLVQRAAASQKRINEFLQTRPEIESPAGDEVTFTRQVSFRNVSYTYPGKTIPALQQFNLEIRKGQAVGILGSTGSGKTTVAQLLMRMMDPDEGEILVDDKRLKELDLRKFRNLMGYVPQDVFLFSDTIRNNIRFGAGKHGGDEKLNQAVYDSGLTQTIEEFADGLETIVGERGITLSGGQKQRVSIARALLRDADILVFDDCLSALDTKTEAFILDRLQQRIDQKTAVIISHRVSSVRLAGHIVFLQDGKVMEEGSHEQLMQRKGLYFDLHQKQKSGEGERH